MLQDAGGGGNNSIQSMIVSQAHALGLASFIPLDIAQQESGFTNPTPYYDVNGYAVGPFSTHGGFGGYSLSALENPATNILASEKAMLPAYQKGVSLGLSGAALLDYTANNSGWPLETGVAAANEYEPQYDANLNQIYNATGGSSNVSGSISNFGAIAGNSIGKAQDAFVGWAEQIDSELEIPKPSVFSILNPFGSGSEVFKPLVVRIIFFVVGLVIILAALVAMANEDFAGMFLGNNAGGGEASEAELSEAALV